MHEHNCIAFMQIFSHWMKPLSARKSHTYRGKSKQTFANVFIRYFHFRIISKPILQWFMGKHSISPKHTAHYTPHIYICISIVSHNDTEKTAYKHYNGIFGIVFHIGWHDFHSILMYTWWMGMGMRAILYLYKCAIRLNHNIPKIRLNLKVFRLCGTSHSNSNSNSTIIRPESLASHPQNPIYAKYSPRFFKSDIENGNNFAFLTQTDLCSQFLSFFPFHPLRLTYSLFVQSLA